MQGPAPGGNNHKYYNRLEAELLEYSSAERELTVLEGDKFITSWQCVLVVRRASGILGCFRKSEASRSREVRPHLECFVQFWTLQ